MDLLQQVGGLQGFANCGLGELCTVRGVGPAKAAQLKAAVELGKRVMAAPLTTGTRIGSSRDLFHYYHPRLRDLRREVFKVILLDAKHTLIRDVTVSEGSLTLTIVHPREVFNLAVRESAAAVIFLHNHPSGDPQPSAEDRALTGRLAAAGQILGVAVLDHIIVGDGRYFSFADEGGLGEVGFAPQDLPRDEPGRVARPRAARSLRKEDAHRQSKESADREWTAPATPRENDVG